MTIRNWKYSIVMCSDCGDYVAENWSIRHRRNKCTVGKATLHQLLVAFLDNRLPADIGVIECLVRSTPEQLQRWRETIVSYYDMTLEWVTIEDRGSVWAGYDTNRKVLVVGDIDFWK